MPKPKPRQSRKTIAPEARTDKHGVSFRLNDKEMQLIQADLIRLRNDSGITVKVGSYAKHATASHGRLRRIELGLRELTKGLMEDLGNTEGKALGVQLSAILGAA